jgi:hypothetical protein
LEVWCWPLAPLRDAMILRDDNTSSIVLSLCVEKNKRIVDER